MASRDAVLTLIISTCGQAELSQELKTCRETLFPESGAVLTPARIIREVKRPWILVPLALVIAALIVGGVFLVKRSREARWAREVAILGWGWHTLVTSS